MKYKLLKDATNIPKGTIVWIENGTLFVQYPDNRDQTTLSGNLIGLFEIARNNPVWFEVVEEKKSMAERMWDATDYALDKNTTPVIKEMTIDKLGYAIKKADIVDAPRPEDITDEMAKDGYNHYDDHLTNRLGSCAFEDYKDSMKHTARMWREKRGKNG